MKRDLSDGNNDVEYDSGMGNYVFAFFALLLAASCGFTLLLFLRRRQRLRQAELLPTSRRLAGHQRSLTITTMPSTGRGERVFVYDEKMNLIANSSGPPDSPIPEIRVTFPDEQDQNGNKQTGRVVIVKIADSGSVGMEPLRQENLPPYQQSDADRFQSLDLERIGGLREKDRPPQRWS